MTEEERDEVDVTFPLLSFPSFFIRSQRLFSENYPPTAGKKILFPSALLCLSPRPSPLSVLCGCSDSRASSTTSGCCLKVQLFRQLGSKTNRIPSGLRLAVSVCKCPVHTSTKPRSHSARTQAGRAHTQWQSLFMFAIHFSWPIR